MADQMPRMPNFWWCPTHHLYRGGDDRPCADAVRLVPEAEVVTEDNRIPEIWAVLERSAHWTSATHPAAGDAKTLQRIRAILDSAPPAPRVFLPGDTVPAGVQVSISFGARLLDPDAEDRVLERTAVEVVHLSPEEWQAAVDRARAAREENPHGE